MQFRSYSDLARAVSSNLSRVPSDVDLIVGIPRSGLIPASVVSLGLNLPMTDIEGLLAGRLAVTRLTRRIGCGALAVRDCSHALVLDDSIYTGSTLAVIKERIRAAQLPLRVTYAAVYATPESAAAVDLFFEVCPRPRVFEWHYLHHHVLATALIALDGVLGVDSQLFNAASSTERASYLAGLQPRVRPTARILGFVTDCVSAGQADLQAWLQRHGITFQHLILRDRVPRRSSDSLAHKARAYRRETRATLFLDGSSGDGQRIASRSGKPVIDVRERVLYEPHPLAWCNLKKRGRRLWTRALAQLAESNPAAAAGASARRPS